MNTYLNENSNLDRITPVPLPTEHVTSHVPSSYSQRTKMNKNSSFRFPCNEKMDKSSEKLIHQCENAYYLCVRVCKRVCKQEYVHVRACMHKRESTATYFE